MANQKVHLALCCFLHIPSLSPPVLRRVQRLGLGRVRDSLPPGLGGCVGGVLPVKGIPPWSDLRPSFSELFLLEKLRRNQKNVVCVAEKILGKRWAEICAQTVDDAARKGEELEEQPDHLGPIASSGWRGVRLFFLKNLKHTADRHLGLKGLLGPLSPELVSQFSNSQSWECVHCTLVRDTYSGEK